MSSTELVTTPHATELDNVERALAEARTISDVLDIADKAAALQAYARRARLGLEAQNSAAAWKLRAERRAGEMLGETLQHGGDASSRAANLHDIGIQKDESSRWQRIARIPAATFESFVADATTDGRELTQASALKLSPPRPKRERPRRAIAAKTTLALGDVRLDMTPEEDDAPLPDTGAIVHVTGVVRVTRVVATRHGTTITATPVELFVERWAQP